MCKYLNRTWTLVLLISMQGLRLPMALAEDSLTSGAHDQSSGGGPLTQNVVSSEYVLRTGDVVQVKVYQEDDLTALSRIGKDGAITMPLLGSLRVANKTVGQAATLIHDRLAKGYLVNPQVTVNVSEFAKRRFTVLGQVQRPGTYDMPTDESVTLLQAIAAAGGYTRIGNPHKVTVQRAEGDENKVIHLDAEAMAQDKKQKTFEIRPDDVIVVGEKWI